MDKFTNPDNKVPDKFKNENLEIVFNTDTTVVKSLFSRIY